MNKISSTFLNDATRMKMIHTLDTNEMNIMLLCC